MDPGNYQPGFQYGFQQFSDPNIPPPSTAMAPPMTTMHVPVGVGGEEVSFNDSGYFSSPQRSHFTNLTNQLRGPNLTQQPVNHARRPSPVKNQGTAVSDLMGAPRPSWQEDFPSVTDEWDKNFINNFEENLFGFDASDLNHMVDGILNSPFKSSMASPFGSPHQSSSAACGLGLSPFKNLSTSNVMLAPKRSPGHLGGSPFRSPFSSPSPVKGLNSLTRTSPLTRQRRLILQSPVRAESLADPFVDLPDFLGIKEEQADDAVPFQRSNSFGFTPQDDISSSPPLSSFYEDSVLQSSQSGFSAQSFQDINNTTPVRQGKRVKTDSMYNLRSSPSTGFGYNLRSSPSQGYGFNYKLRSSPSKADNTGYQMHSPSKRTSLSQGRISVTHHAQLISELPSKDALRLVRARFKEVLDKASADAAVKEKRLKSKLRSRLKKQEQYPEISQALSRPVSSAGGKSAQGAATYTQLQPHRSGRRRQEILPKPEPDWPRREPCKIAPKKRKR